MKYPGNIHNLPTPFIERRELRERSTLPVEGKCFVIELWINMAWFRLDGKYDKAEDAEWFTKHYNMTPPLRIVECNQAETEIYRAEVAKTPLNNP